MLELLQEPVVSYILEILLLLVSILGLHVNYSLVALKLTFTHTQHSSAQPGSRLSHLIDKPPPGGKLGLVLIDTAQARSGIEIPSFTFTGEYYFIPNIIHTCSLTCANPVEHGTSHIYIKSLKNQNTAKPLERDLLTVPRKKPYLTPVNRHNIY